MRVDIYSDFTLKDILQSYSSIQFSECIRDAGDIQLSFTDGEVYKNIKVTEDILVVGNNAYLAENKHKTDSKDLRKYEITGRHITSVLSWRCVKGFPPTTRNCFGISLFILVPLPPARTIA